MAEKITFIGYDLGDGESVTDIAVLDDASARQRIRITFADMTMPGSNTPGQAIPTAYGYDRNDGTLVFASGILVAPDDVRDIHTNFKRRPGDLLGPVSRERLKAIEERLSVRVMREKGAPGQMECPELFTDGMRKFREAVVTFTNAVFENPKYMEAVVGQSVNSGRVVFCVGHPTKWQPVDVAIYRLILSASVLGGKTYAGKPSELILADESQAVFFHMQGQDDRFPVEEGESVLLIDVGSSTVDVSALTMDSRNVGFNSGNNCVGTRAIDFLIRDWYIEHLCPADLAAFQEILGLNGTLDQALTLECRMAKERVFSLNAHKARIDFLPQFPPALLTMDQIVRLASEAPVGPVLKRYTGIPADAADSMGRKTWTDLFREFIRECRAGMEAEDIHIGRIILTGSAYRMPFVQEVVREVYPELSDNSILKDMNPSRSVSMGLVRIAASGIIETRPDSKPVRRLMETEVPKCIGDHLPDLADKLSTVIQDIAVEKIVKKHVRKWREKEYKTLDDMTAAIERDCRQDRLAPLLESSEEYNRAIRDWMTDKVGADIAQRLMEICRRFGVKGLTPDSLNVMKDSDARFDVMNFDPLDGIMESVAAVVSDIAVTATFDFAMLLLGVILAVPGAGLALIVAITGRSREYLAKRKVAKFVQGYDLPQFARNLLTDEKVDEQMKKPDKDGKTTTQKIKDAILPGTAIADAVKEIINRQIARQADRIIYMLGGQ